MKKLLRQFHSGEKGFTLIELLVVVAILGVLAAVVIPNVGKFMGTGTEQAANTEAHNVQLGVLAAMADENVNILNIPPAVPDQPTVGPGREYNVFYGSESDNLTVISYFTGSLEAQYTLSDDGSIDSAIPMAPGETTSPTGKWKDLQWKDGQWAKPEPAP